MALWGSKATQFAIPQDPDAEDTPIIILFTGCLVKNYFGELHVSGYTACHWYINPDIPEASVLLNSTNGQSYRIKRAGIPIAEQKQPETLPLPDLLTLKEMQDMDPYEFPEKITNCFFHARYKIPLIASDGTEESEMIAFATIAHRIVGNPVEAVMRSSRNRDNIPPDIAAIVSSKFTFSFTMSEASFRKPKKSYQVNGIIHIHGKQPALPFHGPNQAQLTTQNINFHAQTSATNSPPYRPQHSSETPFIQTPTEILPLEEMALQTPPKKTKNPGSSAQDIMYPAGATPFEAKSAKKRLHVPEKDEEQDEEDSSFETAPDKEKNAQSSSDIQSNHLQCKEDNASQESRANAMPGPRSSSATVPFKIHIDRKAIFDTVATKLGLVVDGMKILEIRPGDYSCRVQVSGIPFNDAQERATKIFYGDFAPTPSHATENAFNEILKYLTCEKIIAVDDYNYPDLLQTKKDLDETTARLMIADAIETEYDMVMSHKMHGDSVILSKLDDICAKLSQDLPISIDRVTNYDNGEPTLNVQYTEHSNPWLSSSLYFLPPHSTLSSSTVTYPQEQPLNCIVSGKIPGEYFQLSSPRFVSTPPDRHLQSSKAQALDSRTAISLVDLDDEMEESLSKLQLAILAKPISSCLPCPPTTRTIETMFRQNYHASPQPVEISYFPPDFILQFNDKKSFDTILSYQVIADSNYTFSLAPWTQESRCHTQAWKAPITIDIHGIPPHLFHIKSLCALLDPYCDIEAYIMDKKTGVCTVEGTAFSVDSIPVTDHEENIDPDVIKECSRAIFEAELEDERKRNNPYAYNTYTNSSETSDEDDPNQAYYYPDYIKD
ncbi:hypothetical protein C2845_PM07G21730 [Panicum miliaceum]|uniref:Uncharacterized protein n=1 Tax=Panicum miliaceum TaxID=4540 RepID=A0A3L6SND8_PANMI|nr:hypothetical protein C2845_PM07G21730 [Panicum miliaceum]